MFDVGTQCLMVSMDSTKLYTDNNYYLWKNGKINANPNSPWSSFSIDILDDVQSAYNAAVAEGYFTNTSYDELYISGMNIGWEIPGTYDAEAQIKDISIVNAKERIRFQAGLVLKQVRLKFL